MDVCGVRRRLSRRRTPQSYTVFSYPVFTVINTILTYIVRSTLSFVKVACVLSYAMIPVAASGLGGFIAAFWPPGTTLKSVIQHFAAALELLPSVREQSTDFVIVVIRFS